MKAWNITARSVRSHRLTTQLFPLGGSNLIKRDYKDTRNGVHPTALSDRLSKLTSPGIRRRLPFGARRPKLGIDTASETPLPILDSRSGVQTPDLDISLSKLSQPPPAHSPPHRYSPEIELTAPPEPAPEEPVIRQQLPGPVTADQRRSPWRRAVAIVTTFLSPATIAIIAGLIIALVPKLHGLFYITPSAGIPTAPDGNAPLAILMECVLLRRLRPGLALLLAELRLAASYAEGRNALLTYAQDRILPRRRQRAARPDQCVLTRQPR